MAEHLTYSEWEEKIKKNDIWSVFYKDIMREILNDWKFDYTELHNVKLNKKIEKKIEDNMKTINMLFVDHQNMGREIPFEVIQKLQIENAVLNGVLNEE